MSFIRSNFNLILMTLLYVGLPFILISLSWVGLNDEVVNSYLSDKDKILGALLAVMATKVVNVGTELIRNGKGRNTEKGTGEGP